MNDGFQKRLADLNRILARLREVLTLPRDPVVRDSAILRFELSFEVAWKCVQIAVRRQGLDANSPRQAFEAAFRLGWIRDELIWKALLDARNQAVHVYREEVADALFESLQLFATVLEEIAARLREQVDKV